MSKRKKKGKTRLVEEANSFVVKTDNRKRKDSILLEEKKFIAEEVLPEVAYFTKCFHGPGSIPLICSDTVRITAVEQYTNLNYKLVRLEFSLQYFNNVIKNISVLVKFYRTRGIKMNMDHIHFANEMIMSMVTEKNKQRLRFFPKVYASFSDDYPYFSTKGYLVMVTEDFQSQDFSRILDRSYNLDECMFIFQWMAHYHAVGIIEKLKRPDIFRQLHEMFREAKYGHLSDDRDTTCTWNNDYQDQFVVNFAAITICQGMMTQDNIWIRRSKKTSNLVELKVFDWHKSKVAPCFDDVLQFIEYCDTDIHFEAMSFYVKCLADALNGHVEENVVKFIQYSIKTNIRIDGWTHSNDALYNFKFDDEMQKGFAQLNFYYNKGKYWELDNAS